MATQMRNMVYNLYRNADRTSGKSDLAKEPPLPVVEEPLDGVNQARLQWEQGIAQELHVMAAEQGATLCQPMAPAPDADPQSDPQGNSGFVSGFGSTTAKAPRFLFDSADLLDAIQRIKSANRVQTGAVSQGLPQQWGMIKVQLKVHACSLSDHLCVLTPYLSPPPHPLGC
jgi:hypothetical protein